MPSLGAWTFILKPQVLRGAGEKVCLAGRPWPGSESCCESQHINSHMGHKACLKEHSLFWGDREVQWYMLLLLSSSNTILILRLLAHVCTHTSPDSVLMVILCGGQHTSPTLSQVTGEEGDASQGDHEGTRRPRVYACTSVPCSLSAPNIERRCLSWCCCQQRFIRQSGVAAL